MLLRDESLWCEGFRSFFFLGGSATRSTGLRFRCCLGSLLSLLPLRLLLPLLDWLWLVFLITFGLGVGALAEALDECLPPEGNFYCYRCESLSELPLD